jgi:5-methylcytosine-specific restriction enzyme subunit McrC
MSYQLGGASAPGFVLRTWQIWQDLITTASRLAFGAHRVHVESPSTLGSRTKLPSGGVTTLRVYPDVMVSPEATRSFLLDAKYKGHIDKGQLIVSEADVYESMAFAQATQIDTVVLAYPTPASDPLSAVGSTRAFERVNVGSIRIIAIYVEVRGISKRGGLSAFSSRLASDLVDLTT